MADTVAGGVYEDAPGAGTYHNAKGEPVTKDGKPAGKSEAEGPAKKSAKGAAK